MDIEKLIEQTVQTLNYELVDIEHGPNALIRVLIDQLDQQKQITVEDCELISRQLTYLFEVEAVNYDRLEVSSPGIDRPLKKLADFIRFTGSQANVKLKLPIENRRNFSGEIYQVDLEKPEGEAIQLHFENEAGDISILEFGIEDVDKARLIPVYNFKGTKK